MSKFGRSLVSLIFLSSLLVIPQPPAIVQAFPSPNRAPAASLDYATGVILVGLKPTPAVLSSGINVQSVGGFQSTLDRLQVQSVDPVFPAPPVSLSLQSTQAVGPEQPGLAQIYRLHVPLQADLFADIQQLQADPSVAFAEPDYVAHLVTTPNDPQYSSQWGLAKIQADQAWDTTQGSPDVTIAVIDSGIDAAHEDLAGQLWTNPGEIAGNGIDDDNDGYVDDVNGANVLDHSVDLTDATGHGTQVAGVVAAAANNAKGIAGLCWKCKLMVVKVTNSPSANYSDIAAGVAYAANKGAKVINLSLGGSSDSATLRSAIATAAQTAVVVGGAGNANSSALFYPAAYTQSALAVAGTTLTDAKKDDSNYGTWVSVSAPGENIQTTYSGGGYGAPSGTSLAAPFVSGLAGLIVSQHPDWSPADVRAQIIQTADPIDNLNPSLVGMLGSGRIDAAQAVTTASHPLLSISGFRINSQANGRVEPNSTVDLYVTLQNAWTTAANAQATLTSANPAVTILNGAASFGSVPALGSQTNATALRLSLSSTAGYNADLALTLTVTADGGYSIALPLNVYSSTGISTVHGTLKTTTWTNDRTYVVDNAIGVDAGETLTIRPGTKVFFAGNYTFNVAGTLVADGTPDQPIVFTHQSSMGTWGAINFLAGSSDASFDGSGNYDSGSILRYVTVEYGMGVSLNNVAPYIAHDTFRYLSSGSVAISGTGKPSLVVTDNTLTGANISLTTGSLLARNQLTGGSIYANSFNRVSDNDVRDYSSGTGITVMGVPSIISGNHVFNCKDGLEAAGGLIQGNLTAHNQGVGLRIWGIGLAVTALQNTVIGNGGPGVFVGDVGSLAIHQNNLVPSNGQYAVQNRSSKPIDAAGNWWGTSDVSTIPGEIYDGQDEFGLGIVDFSGSTSAPDANAPAYVTGISLDPASPVGIQTVKFDVSFSRAMDPASNPQLTFASTRRGTFTAYNSGNSGLKDQYAYAIIEDSNGVLWFSNGSHGLISYDGQTWKEYSKNTQSNWPVNSVIEFAFDNSGALWLTDSYNLYRFDGTNWVEMKYPNQGTGEMQAIKVDGRGNVWIWLENPMDPVNGAHTIASYDGTKWTSYTKANSGLPDTRVRALTPDNAGNVWIGTATGGIAKFTGSTWTVYNSSNSPIPGNNVSGLAVDKTGKLWATVSPVGVVGGYISSFDGSQWTVNPNPVYPGGPSLFADIAVDPTNHVWFLSVMKNEYVEYDGNHYISYRMPSGTVRSGTFLVDRQGNVWGGGSGAMVLWGGVVYPIDQNTRWEDASHWSGTYDMTSLIARDDYRLSISGSGELEDIPVAPSGNGFTVDYAGQINDTTPPSKPSVFATGKPEDITYVHASWTGSATYTYRYAIGTTAGAADVVNWTTISVPQLTRTGLGLVAGKTYFVSVQARNAGGLWSPIGSSPFTAGTQSLAKTFLPLTKR